MPPLGSVMVLSAASGGGHVRAADALVSAFEMQSIPAAHVEVLQHTTPFLRSLYADHYVQTVKRCPWLLGLAYRAMAAPRRFERSRLLFDLLQARCLVSLLRAANPGVILCTHFLPAEIAVHLRRKAMLRSRIGVVLTDFDVHPLWIYRSADWYFVASEDARARLVEMKVSPARIHVTGIPIDQSFTMRRSRAEARMRMGLHRDLPTILVAAGGFGMGPVESLVEALHRTRRSIQIVVICGRNEALRRRLACAFGSRHPTKVIGYTEEMDGWMAAADLLVGKAGGLTCAEALARELVPVIVNPIPGPEERNAAILMKEGVAVHCRDVAALGAAVDELLAEPERLSRMRRAVARVARPRAASEIVHVVAGSPLQPRQRRIRAGAC